MPEAFTMQFSPDVAEFVQAQATASNHSVASFVESLLLREKARIEEGAGQLTVQAAADLLRHQQHDLLRDPQESDTEYANRAATFATLLDHARQG